MFFSYCRMFFVVVKTCKTCNAKCDAFFIAHVPRAVAFSTDR